MPRFLGDLPFGFFRDEPQQQQEAQNRAAQGAAQQAVAQRAIGGLGQMQAQQGGAIAMGYGGAGEIRVQQGGWAQIDAMPLGYARPRRDPFAHILDFSDEWAREGLMFNEIVVPKHTFHKLYAQFGVQAYYQRADMQPEIPKIPKEFVYNTAMGPVRIVCQEDRAPVFNLDKYMETVDE